MKFIIILLIFSYLVGSWNASIFLCQRFHLPDPRTQGSKNPGATNMMRTAGQALGLFTLVLDILKGMTPVLIAKCFEISEAWQAWVAFTVVIGHIYPIFFHFRGGKGVATAMGALCALAWPIGGYLALIWLSVITLTRYVSLSSIIGSLSLPFIAYFLGYFSMLIPLTLISLNVIFKHKSNIQRLLVGKEPKNGKK